MPGDELSKEVAQVVKLEENFRAADSKDHTGTQARTTEQALQDEVQRINSLHKGDKKYMQNFANALAAADEHQSATHGAVYPTVELVGDHLAVKQQKQISAETAEASARKRNSVDLNEDPLAEKNAQSFREDLAKGNNRQRYREIYGLPNATDDELVKMHSLGDQLTDKAYDLQCLARGIDIHAGPQGHAYDLSNPADKAKVDQLVAQKRQELQEALDRINHQPNPSKGGQTYAQHLIGGMSDIYTFDKFAQPPNGALVLNKDGYVDIRPNLNSPSAIEAWAKRYNDR